MLNLILALALILNPMLPAHAAGGKRSTGGSASEVCWRILEGDMHVWGQYKCNNCGQMTSAGPNEKGVEACSSCGTPHTNEKFQAPPKQKSGSSVKVLARLMESGYVGNNHFRLLCDSCGGSNFMVQPDGSNTENCGHCGTSLYGSYVLVQTTTMPQLTPFPPDVGHKLDYMNMEKFNAKMEKARLLESVRIAYGKDIPDEVIEKMLMKDAPSFIRFMGEQNGKKEEAEQLANAVEEAVETGNLSQDSVEGLRNLKDQADEALEVVEEAEAEKSAPVAAKPKRKPKTKFDFAKEWLLKHKRQVIAGAVVVGSVVVVSGAYWTIMWPEKYPAQMERITTNPDGSQNFEVEYLKDGKSKFVQITTSPHKTDYQMDDKVEVFGSRMGPVESVQIKNADLWPLAEQPKPKK